jgi:hypothetical protein
MTPVLRKTSTPVYSIENLSLFPMNPYRLFVYHCAGTLFPAMEDKLNMSLAEFFKMSEIEREHLIEKTLSKFAGVEVIFAEKTSHARVFLEAEIKSKGSHICKLQFFTHMTYLAGNSREESDVEFVACEINFNEFDGFDFTGVSRGGNVIDFAKSDSDPEVMDMIFAHIYGLVDFTEYVKVYKAKSLIIKNINLFCDKLITPYVSDIQTAFSPESFIIGAICGETIHKMTYKYEDYLTSVKSFSEGIKQMYGEKYKIEKEEKEAKKNNNNQ